MAIRVHLTKSIFCLVLFRFPQIRTTPFQKSRSFSQPPNLSNKIPSISPGKSQFLRQISLSNLLQRYGFPPTHLPEFLQKNRYLLDFDLPDIEKSLHALLSFRLSQKSLISILFSCPRILELGFLRKWEVGFAQLGVENIRPSLIQTVLEQSGRFGINPDQFNQNFRALKNAGFSDETLIRVLEENPRWVMMSAASINHQIDVFTGIGIRSYEFNRICYSFPAILGINEERLRCLFEEFGHLGFSGIEIRKMILHDPQVLCMELGELSRNIELLRNFKCREPIKEKILQNGIFRAGFEVKLRVDCLCRYGLIRRDAFKILQREPRVIIYELEDVEKKIDFLLNRMHFSIESLIEVPQYLGVNLEKQIVPRYNVIEYLRSIGGLGFEVGLMGLVRPSRLRFYNLFVKPYPECEKIFGGLLRTVEVKSKHPIGLWKLFKPPRYQKSKEDLRNIKLFMESLA